MDAHSPMADLFDSLADSYDAMGVDFFGPIAAGLVAEVAPGTGDRCLDVGCGRGAALIPLAHAVGADGHAMGIDISPRMVALTRQAISDAKLPARVEVGDAAAPAFGRSCFDVVVSSLVLFFLPDPAAALERWRTLLVPGGRVGVSTFGPHDEQWRTAVDAVLQRYAPPGVRDARTTGASGPFGSDAGMEALLAGAGYQGVRTATSVVSPRFDDAEHWYRWSMSVGQRQFWMAIPPDELDAVKAEVLAGVEQCRDQDGRIGFDQQVRYTLATC